MSSALVPINKYLRKVVISNQIGEYPPYNLTKVQFQVLLSLIAHVDSKSAPIYGIDDLKEEIERLGIPKEQHMDYVEQVVYERNTYRVPASEILRLFSDGKTPRGSVIKRVVDALNSLNQYPIKSRHPDFTGSTYWFTDVLHNKKDDEISFTIGRNARQFLLGLNGNFLQMLAESTLKFDGRYSVPIFMYMKSKLFEGADEFHGEESVEEFRARFGLDEIKTYNRFYELERRILKKAEKDAKKSDDISFTFTGISGEGTRKITILKYHIYRIGNIHQQQSAAEKAARKTEREIKLEQVTTLPKARKLAYDFLVKKGVNRHFILDRIIEHDKLKQSEIVGYEDLFFELLWEKFTQSTKATKLAGAFVSWWKKGILHRDDHFWFVIDQLRKHKQQLSEAEHAYRKIANTMSAEEYKKYRDDIQAQRTQPAKMPALSENKKSIGEGMQRIGKVLPKKSAKLFDINTFKTNYFSEYSRIQREVKSAFTDLKDSLAVGKYQTMVANRIEVECRRWFTENVK